MNAMNWIAIAAIIVPYAIKAYEQHLTHKKQAVPKPIENQPNAASHGGITRLERLRRRIRWLDIAGAATCVFGILNSIFYLVYRLIGDVSSTSRLSMAVSAFHVLVIAVDETLLRYFRKELHFLGRNDSFHFNHH